MTIQLNHEQIKAVSRAAAEKIYERLDALPQTGWVHGACFLPANVTTDYHGQMKFIQLMEACIQRELAIVSDPFKHTLSD